MNTATLAAGLMAISLQAATPLILGSLGEIIIEKSGVLNLGIEGTMFLGAFVGFFVGYFTDSASLGIITAVIVGALLGLIMAVLTVSLGLDQHVSGIGITFLATEIGLFLYQALYHATGNPPHLAPLKAVKIAFLNQIPMLGVMLKQQGLTYLALMGIPVIHTLVFNSKFGLRLRAVGEKAVAADVAGINVIQTRYKALILGSALMGLGGGFLSVAQSGFVTPGIIGGRGWICIALVVFGNWKPVRVVLGALLFGGVGALQYYLQTVGLGISYEYFLMLPYILTMAAMALSRGKTVYPAEFLKAYQQRR